MSVPPILELHQKEIPLPGSSSRSLCVSLEICAGDLCLVRGANGAGKSTFLKWLYSNLQETAVPSVSARYLSQGADEDFILPSQLLDVSKGVCGEDAFAPEDALFPKELWHIPWNKASLGERQRALLAGTMRGKLSLLLLDEPTSALDVQAEKLFWDRLQKICLSGVAVLVVYHGRSEGLPKHKELFL